MTARIDELNEEAEHWRSLGKEADDKLDGLRVSLDVAREQLQHQESIRTVPLIYCMFFSYKC